MDRKMALQEAATGTVTPGIARRPGTHAWMVSIFVHALILAGLWFVRFPQDRGLAGPQIVPLATVSHVRKVTQSSAVIPKPKVRLPSESARPHTETSGRSLITARLDEGRPGISAAADRPAIGAQSRVPEVPDDTQGLVGRIGFFGSYSQHRKVCYVVDCSGSMKGLFAHVQDRLKQSIGDLQPDQYFNIIFFGNAKLREFADGKLNRASDRNKSAACDFVDSMHPAGTTNAQAAIERALKTRDIDGNAPSVIYFLTDGFDLEAKGSASFSRNVTEMAERFAPATEINTIGFWPQDDDRTVLEAIARQTGGACVLIAGDAADPNSQY